jgi:hypothetical protein
MADLEIFDVAQNHWLQGWPKSVYTSLSYYTTLARFSSTSFEEFVKFGIPKNKKHPAMNPDVRAQITKAIKDMSAEELRLLYNNTGLCTAWAVQIAKATEMETDVNFHFVDSGKHRLAYEDNGVILDSSAKQVILLRSGSCVHIDPATGGQTTYNVENYHAIPTFNYTVQSETGKERKHSTTACTDWQDAMKRCLTQSIHSPSVVISCG